MTTKRLEKIEDIAKLLTVKDDIEKYMPCTHTEWVQWLISQIESKRVFIWADIDEDSVINSYIVVFNMVNPPLGNHLFIPYVFSSLKIEENLAVLEDIKELANSLGAKKISAKVEKAENFKKYGFEKVAEIIELKV